MTGRLSQAAIRLLERASVTWTPFSQLELTGLEPELAELKRGGFVETRVWPPPTTFRYRHRFDRGYTPPREQATAWELRKTRRGLERLARIHGGRL